MSGPRRTEWLCAPLPLLPSTAAQMACLCRGGRAARQALPALALAVATHWVRNQKAPVTFPSVGAVLARFVEMDDPSGAPSVVALRPKPELEAKGSISSAPCRLQGV